MQMVLMPEDADQIIPLAKLGKELRPDYAIIKHCSDNEDEVWEFQRKNMRNYILCLKRPKVIQMKL